ncbi:MAG TPA: SulP family inorganic anion transporter [Ilumatobacteraceae bacterium]|nr:SulP family inorganic anion transporter [Ilumatobacteraceae bacterium]
MSDDRTSPSGSTAAPSSGEMPTAPSRMQVWFPAGVWLRKYDWGKNITADLIAAISVAALLIPESMGYSSVAGVPAQIGLYAAPLALIGYALFGGSKLMVYAAAGSVAAVSASVVGNLSGGDQDTAVLMTSALALTAGVVFVVAGLVRLGWIVNFISKAVMAGFITGMSVQIIIGQLGKLFGVDTGDGNSLQKLWSAVSSVADWDATATLIGVISIAAIFAIQKYVPRLPAALTMVVLTSVYVAMVDPDIDLVAEIPTGMPSFGVPSGISGSDWLTLVLGGAVVALVGFSEGWGASATISKQTHDDLTANQEFRAYGVGSIGAGILGGMPVTGSLSKSSAAMEAGARTQMSNVFLAGIVILTLLVFAPAFQWLPETVLAAVVITAMWGSASPAKLERLWRIDRVDFTLGVLTGFIVLTFDLLPAMIVGIVVSIAHLLYRVSFPGTAVLGREESTGDFEAITASYGSHTEKIENDALEVPGVIVFRFSAPLVFSNAEAFEDATKQLLIDAGQSGSLPTTLVIDCEVIPFVDSTGAAALSSTFRYAKRYGVELAVARLHEGAKQLMVLSGDLDEIGEHRFHSTVRDAVAASTTGR